MSHGLPQIEYQMKADFRVYTPLLYDDTDDLLPRFLRSADFQVITLITS